MEAARSASEIASFHAHVYFEMGGSDAAARRLREQVAERFAVRLGTWHERPVGPHAKPMFQIAFANELFDRIVPWLMLNHRGLSILIHPNTVFARRDHVSDCLWIGTPVPLDQALLPEREEVPEEPGEPNTRPHLQP